MAEPRLDQIHIRDLQLRCIIGIYPEERREKQDVVINVTLFADLRKAGRTDDIRNTVDYKAIKKAIVALVDGSAFLLVERLADRIAGTALAERRVRAVTVRVAKPGALRFARTVEVEIHRTARPSRRRPHE